MYKFIIKYKKKSLLIPNFVKKIHKMSGWFKNHWLLILIFIFAFSVRFWHLQLPSTYYFDEVYNAFTAEAYARNDHRGYEWWNEAPTGFAYEWTNPPLGRLFGAAGIILFGDNTFGWRFFGALFGSLFPILFYWVGSSVFNKRVGVLAALLYSLETLFLAQSRILLVDIFFLFFLFFAFFLTFFLLKNPKPNLKLLILTGIVFGLASATRMSTFWGLAVICILFLLYFIFIKKKILQAFLYPAIVGLIAFVIYLASFTQFFIQGHTFIYLSDVQAFFHNLVSKDEIFYKGQFIELHNQIWRFETGLTATHLFSSVWTEWIVGRGAIWYWTGQQGNLAGNIWAIGNPVIFILGAISIGFIIFRFAETRKLKFGIILLGYFSLLIPWMSISRLTFLYHYLPSLSFAILALAIFLDSIWQSKFKFMVILVLIASLAVFIYFFPYVTGIYLPQEQVKFFNDLVFKFR